MIYVGLGREEVDMYRGNFKITDYVTERYPLRITEIKRQKTVFALFSGISWKPQ